MTTRRQYQVYKAELASGAGYLGHYQAIWEAQNEAEEILRTRWWRRHSPVRQVEVRYKPTNEFCYGHQHQDDQSRGLVVLASGALCQAFHVS